jgi:hypothetical protein
MFHLSQTAPPNAEPEASPRRRLGRLLRSWRLRLRRTVRLAGSGMADAGMTTAEYAVGTLAACAFAGVLYVVVRSGAVHSLLQSVITKALNLAP